MDYAANIGGQFAEAATSGPLILGILAAALAGLVSFASPCVIPLVPGSRIRQVAQLQRFIAREVPEETALAIDIVGFAGWREVLPDPTAGRAGHDEVIGVADRLLGPGGRLVVHTTVAPGRPTPAVVELAAWESRYVSEAGPPVAWSELVDAIERALGPRGNARERRQAARNCSSLPGCTRHQ